MSSMKEKVKKGGLASLVIILLIAVVYGISWIATCGIIKLICLCFGWDFSWGITTGIWLIILLVRGTFHVTVTNKSR